MRRATESAYPSSNGTEQLPGLNKRELFAAMAMQGLCANVGLNASAFGSENIAAVAFALAARQMADALLQELDEQRK